MCHIGLEFNFTIVYSQILIPLPEEEMAAITFGIYKVVSDLPIRELDDAEFYEGTENLKFFVHKYDAENLHLDALVRIS
jgi:hypothetical protein